jgi:hypothetical protein
LPIAITSTSAPHCGHHTRVEPTERTTTRELVSIVIVVFFAMGIGFRLTFWSHLAVPPPQKSLQSR